MFSLVQHHKYSLNEVDELIPFERDLYVSMLSKWLQEQEEKARKAAQK